MGRKFPAGDLRRTQPITSKAEVRGGEGGGGGGEEGSGEEAEGARQTREKSMRRKQRSGREWTITALGAPLFSPLIG